MMIIWKGRGILIPVFYIANIVILGLVADALKTNIGGIFAVEYSFFVIVGIALLVSSILIKLLDDEYYKNDKGERIKYPSIINSFFLIRMKYWVIISIVGGLAFLVLGILNII